MLINYSCNFIKEITKLNKNIFEQKNSIIIFKFKEEKLKISNQIICFVNIAKKNFSSIFKIRFYNIFVRKLNNLKSIEALIKIKKK